VRELLAAPDIRVGITTAYYYSQLVEAKLRVRMLKEDTGYVLFAAAEQDAGGGTPAVP